MRGACPKPPSQVDASPVFTRSRKKATVKVARCLEERRGLLAQNPNALRTPHSSPLQAEGVT